MQYSNLLCLAEILSLAVVMMDTAILCGLGPFLLDERQREHFCSVVAHRSHRQGRRMIDSLCGGNIWSSSFAMVMLTSSLSFPMRFRSCFSSHS